LVNEGLHSGTTTVEIKSGYGLTVKDELRSLQIAKQLTNETTFSGAHVVPSEYKGKADEYVELICEQTDYASKTICKVDRCVLR
jgi:imidazolonepropionase